MRTRTLWIALAAALALGGVSRAEQIRLKSGDYLQGTVIGDETNDETLTIKLYRTGGKFSLPWDRLIREDEDRLREDLGLTPVDIEEIPRVPGHQLILRNGEKVFGLVENPDATSGPVIVRTATGRREYPRSMVAKFLPAAVEALEVYSSRELAARYREELQPSTPSAFVEFGDRCMSVAAYEEAKDSYDEALADPEFAGSERAQIVKNRLARVAILLEAKDATDRVQEIKRLAFRDKFDEALVMLGQLQEDYSDRPAILKLLNLDRLERQLKTDRRKHFLSEVRRRFYRVMGNLVSKRVRDKEASASDVIQWAQNQRGLAHEIFATIAEETGLDEAEVKEFWEQRTSRQVHRYNYRSGTFLNREVSDRVRKTMAAARASQQGRNRSGGRNRNQPRNQPRQQQKPLSMDEWWSQSSPRVKEDFIKAWFAEYGDTLEVLRYDTRLCSNCAGKGVTITKDPMSDEDIQKICPVCNLAGQERIVVCR